MHMRVVNMKIKQEYVEAFKVSSTAGIEKLLDQHGVVSTALLQQVEAPSHFFFIEVYSSLAAYNEHLKSECYLDWQREVAQLLDGALESAEYAPIYPLKDAWVDEPGES
ncbi:MAG TPA: antibiotic biosynthesis monooxygenase [Anaerolineales bacterium]|nr:antibiotic biosynthesis monooxygenase [Anaerolineales bacterium]